MNSTDNLFNYTSKYFDLSAPITETNSEKSLFWNSNLSNRNPSETIKVRNQLLILK